MKVAINGRCAACDDGTGKCGRYEPCPECGSSCEDVPVVACEMCLEPIDEDEALTCELCEITLCDACTELDTSGLSVCANCAEKDYEYEAMTEPRHKKKRKVRERPLTINDPRYL